MRLLKARDQRTGACSHYGRVFFFFFCLLASFFLFLTESGLWEHLSENFILIGRTTRISIARRSLNRMPTDVVGGGENNGYIIPESYTSGSAMLIEKV